jgi:hypothetical protein
MDVITYSSDVPGIAYYDLKPTGAYQQTVGEKIIRTFENYGKSPQNYVPTPSPVRGPIIAK